MNSALFEQRTKWLRQMIDSELPHADRINADDNEKMPAAPNALTPSFKMVNENMRTHAGGDLTVGYSRDKSAFSTALVGKNQQIMRAKPERTTYDTALTRPEPC